MRITKRVKKRLQARLLEHLANGATIASACGAAGVPRSTFYAWLKTDTAFSEQVELAQGQAIARAEQVILDAIAAGDAKTAMWWLERRCPEYNPKRPPQPEVDDYELVLEVVPSRQPAAFQQPDWNSFMDRLDTNGAKNGQRTPSR